MKLSIIDNPQAGNGSAKALLAQVMAYLKFCQIESKIIQTGYSGHAVGLVAKMICRLMTL